MVNIMVSKKLTLIGYKGNKIVCRVHFGKFLPGLGIFCLNVGKDCDNIVGTLRRYHA